MTFVATSRYTICRGTATDEFNDPIDADTVIASGVLASVLEQSRTVFNPADGRATVVRTLTGRFRHGTDLLAGDRISDERSSDKYVVVDIHTVASGFNKADLVANLTRNDTPNEA